MLGGWGPLAKAAGVLSTAVDTRGAGREAVLDEDQGCVFLFANCKGPLPATPLGRLKPNLLL